MKYITKKGIKYKVVKTTQSSGLDWWLAKGFKVVEKDLKYKALNGKEYPAVKGVTKDNKTLTLKAIYGGSCYTSKDF